MKKKIISILRGVGWLVATEREDHICCAKRIVNTFRGMDFAHINPISFDEVYGIYHLSASFITKEENALSLCHCYFKEGDDIESKISIFHDRVMVALSNAYSIKIAS